MQDLTLVENINAPISNIGVDKEAANSGDTMTGDSKEPVVTRKELWSYYLYYSGDNGIGPLTYTLTLFQLLATEAGYDPVNGPGSSCTASDASGQCVVGWANGTKAVASVVLTANGISFAIMAFFVVTVGSVADYGTFGRYLLVVVTLLCWAAQFACLTLTVPSRWPISMALYIAGFVACAATWVFYIAAYPRLARNTAKTREVEDKYRRREISKDECDVGVSLEKNRISNISLTFYTIGGLVVLCLSLSILIPLADHPLVNNYTIVLTTAYWVITGIWWFIFQESRPGPPIPEGENYLTIGWKRLWVAAKQYKKLPDTFTYLFAIFLLGDGFATSVTLVTICQNDQFQSSFLQNTYLGLAKAIASIVGTLGFWYIQRYFKISTKTMLIVTNVFTIMINLWGMIGLWTDKIGYHNTWEFWGWNIIFGLFQAPYWAYSKTMMAELTPPGFENLFFSLLGLSSSGTSIIGSNVIQVIIDDSGNNWMGFPFILAMCTVASLVIWFGVDVERGRGDAKDWAEEQKTKGRPKF
ncbi:Autophagy-related protein 22-like protein [Amanita muscaria]